MYIGVRKQKVVEGKSQSYTCLHWEFFSLSDIANCFLTWVILKYTKHQMESWDIFDICVSLFVKNITKGDDCEGILH